MNRLSQRQRARLDGLTLLWLPLTGIAGLASDPAVSVASVSGALPDAGAVILLAAWGAGLAVSLFHPDGDTRHDALGPLHAPGVPSARSEGMAEPTAATDGANQDEDAEDDAASVEAVLEALDDGVLILRGGRVLAVNRVATSLLKGVENLEVGATLPTAFVDALPPPGHGSYVDHGRFGESGTSLFVRHEQISEDRSIVKVRDVSDVEATREALHEKNALLEGILQTSLSAVAVVNSTGRITYANAQAEDILGLTPSAGAWRYETLDWRVTHVDGSPARTSDLPLQRVLRTGEAVHDMQVVIRWPDGTRKRLNINASPLDAGTADPKVVVSVGDATDLDRTTRRLEQETTFSEAVINSLPGIFFMIDSEGRHQRWNDNFERLIGYSTDEIAGRALPDLFDTGDRTMVATRVDGVLDPARSSSGFTMEAHIVAKDGTRTPFFFTGLRVRIDGEAYVVGMGLDITEQKERERELRIAKDTAEAARHEADIAREEAEKMNRLKTAFLANMSHEIRTPLTAILGFSEVLRDDPSTAHVKRFAAMIERGGQRLMKTLSAILEISKLEAGTRTLKAESVDVVEQTAGVLAGLSDLADEVGVTLDVDLPGGSLPVNLDADAYRQVLTSLVDNAIRFTDAPGHARVSVEAGSDVLRLVVEDDGIGIEDAFLDSLFDPFTQASKGHNRHHEGTGLGLAIAHRLVTLMDGTIAVDTEAGAGTRFTVVLPVGGDG